MKTLHDSNMVAAWLEIFLCEFFGTSLLMYFACMGVFTAAGESKGLAHLLGGIVCGFTVSTIIVSIGHLSKAHVNPSVSLCAFLLGQISFITAAIYVMAQIFGALLGMCLLKISVPDTLYNLHNTKESSCGFCSTNVHPDLSLPQAFFLEFLATSFLIMVVCSVSDARNEKINDSTPIKFALLLTMLTITVGPFTGASMNPARSLAPAILNNGWQNQWLYWLAPLSASMVTTLFYKHVILRRVKTDKASQYSVNMDQDYTTRC